MSGIHQVAARRLARPDCHSLCVIGDPGCDGLTSLSMRVYEEALLCASSCDLTLVVGDLVPVGEEKYYRTVKTITDTFAENEVFVLRGNHDTGMYEQFFGNREYAVDGDGFTLVVLDNSQREFKVASLAFLGEILASGAVHRAVVAFHIPLPNQFCGNSIPASEAEKLRTVCAPFRDKIAYFVCGHVHSRFRGEFDGIPLICTGGGGAAIEDVSPEIRAADIEHHVVKFVPDGSGELECVFCDLPARTAAEHDHLLQRELETAVRGELMAHLHYLTLAGRAVKRGDFASGAMFRAVAESEYRHARNFFTLLDSGAPITGLPAQYRDREKFEAERFYPMLADCAAARRAPAAQLAFEAAAAAEKIHAAMLNDLIAGESPHPEGYEVCSACGFLRKKGASGRCPVCGVSTHDFIAFTADAEKSP